MFKGGKNLVARRHRSRLLSEQQQAFERENDAAMPLIGNGGDEETGMVSAVEGPGALPPAEEQVLQDTVPSTSTFSAPPVVRTQPPHGEPHGPSPSPFGQQPQQQQQQQQPQPQPQLEPWLEGHEAAKGDAGLVRASAPASILAGNGNGRSNWQRAGRAIQGRAGVPHTHLPGSVQGIDLKRSPEEWAWLSSQWRGAASILCVDFCPDKVSLQPNIKPAALSEFLKQPRPAWSRVRWINMDGLSWEAIQSLALHFDLHPLAVEDIVHIPQRIKADFYEHFLYISCHLITLAGSYADQEAAGFAPPQTLRPALKSAIAAAARPTLPGTGPHRTATAAGAGPAAGLPAFPGAPQPSSTYTSSYAGDQPLPAAAAAAAAAPSGPGAGAGSEGDSAHSVFATCVAGKAGQVVEVGALVGGQQAAVLHSLPGQQPLLTTSDVAAHIVEDEQLHAATAGADGHGLHGQPGRRLGRVTSVSMSHRNGDVAHGAGSRSPSMLQRVGELCGPKMDSFRRRAAGGAGGAAALLETGVPVHKQQVSILVLDSNTIVSIFETAGTAVTRPLLQQLRAPGTLAREAQDASYLACILLDALADSAYPVVDAYSGIVESYEARILGSKPDAGETKDLHLIQGDLATLRRTLLPTLHLVTGLRMHSVDARTPTQPARPGATTTPAKAPAAASPGATQQQPKQKQHADGQAAHAGAGGGGVVAAVPGTPVPVFTLHPLVTRLTKTYLGDVQDHLTSLLDALDSQTEACRDLIDLAFNLIAHRTNAAMQTLTVVSVLFLPLTFLAGIYGMNFDILPELHWHYGYAYFYGLSLTIVTLFLIAMYRMGVMSFS